MRITSVEYRRLVSFGNYENESVGATATVEEGDFPTLVLADLRKFVAAELDAKLESAADRAEISAHKMDIMRYQVDLDEIKRRWEKAKDFLAKHGVDTNRLDADIPF